VRRRHPLLLGVAALALACGHGARPAFDACPGVTCSGHGVCATVGTAARCACDPGFVRSGPTACVASVVPALGGCPLFPADHLFNTPIDGLPVHPQSAAFMASIGTHPLHLDLGQDTVQSSPTYYGIPYNVVHGAALAWAPIHYGSGYPDESDCAAAGATGAVVSPCTSPSPVLPVPASPLVEGGIDARVPRVPGDHHLLVVDADACRLWELYAAYPHAGGGWDILSSATWDLASSALRPSGWTSADAAGLPILPLLLRADEASSGEIRHALRFTLPTIRNTHVWPARHDAGSASSASVAPMGQLFRLKPGTVIPAGFSTQSKAILQALATYGMYLADNGSAMYVQGEPSAAWSDLVFSEVQSIGSASFEAVDLSPFTGRTGFDPASARVPPP
jgi:hypothetical protein